MNNKWIWGKLASAKQVRRYTEAMSYRSNVRRSKRAAELRRRRGRG